MYFCELCKHVPCSSKQLVCEHLKGSNLLTEDYSFKHSVSEQFEVDESVRVVHGNSLYTVDKSKFCEQNFKIGTLNVRGLKRRLKYPEFVKLIRQYSILCVTETKIDESDIISAPNYTFFQSQELKNSNVNLVELDFFCT